MSPFNIHNPHTSASIQSLLDKIRDGDSNSIQTLLDSAVDRLRILARSIAKDIPQVKRFEETDDILQNSMIRLWKALSNHHPQNPLEFYRLASALIRRELVDLARHYFGKEGMGRHVIAEGDQSTSMQRVDQQADETSEPSKLLQWTEFHEYVESLDEEHRTLFDLLWYQGLTLNDAGVILGSTERTVRRRWKEARLQLGQRLLG